MEYFPIFARLARRRVLVIGGGAVAERKIRLLRAAGARVRLVAPALSPALAELAAAGSVDWRQGRFRVSDLSGAWLVFSATDDPALQARAKLAAEARHIWFNAVDDREACGFISPAVIDRSPVLVAVASGGASPVLSRWLRARIETLLPRSTGRLAAFLGRFRRAIADAFPDLDDRRRFIEWLIRGPVGAQLHADREHGAELLLRRRLAQPEPLAESGWVSLVGAGPGDPELLTLKGLQRLQQADVIVHDGLVDARVLDLARRDARRIDVAKRPGGRGWSQHAINALLSELAAAGEQVVRLKGGDPFVFGRGGEEIDWLRRHGIPYEVVPGITAAVGCAAYAGIPLTHREYAHAFSVTTGRFRAGDEGLDWRALSTPGHTLAFYMAVRQLHRVRSRLLAGGRDPATPVALVEHGTRPDQRVITGRLDELAALAGQHQVRSPAMVFVGEVAALADSLGWYGEGRSQHAAPAAPAAMPPGVATAGRC